MGEDRQPLYDGEREEIKTLPFDDAIAFHVGIPQFGAGLRPRCIMTAGLPMPPVMETFGQLKGAGRRRRPNTRCGSAQVSDRAAL